jgi:hypothetical protein
MRDISFLVAPIPDHAFFEQAVLQGQVGNRLLQRRQLATQILDLVCCGLPFAVSPASRFLPASRNSFDQL